MTTKFKYTATSSNGIVGTRTSHRDYSVAVFATHTSDGRTVNIGFSRDLGTARSFMSYAKYGWVNFEFVAPSKVEIKARAKKAQVELAA